MASTRLNEMGFNSDWIEMQLAHVEANKIRDAYNNAEYVEKRRDMMQKWSDYLDNLKGNSNG
jgi:integrase